jgi:hypothetical protein
MEDQNYQTVADIVQAYLCCTSGACQAVFPLNALEFRETPDGRDALDCAVGNGQLQIMEVSRESALFGQSIEMKKKAFSGYSAHWLSMVRYLPVQAETFHYAKKAQRPSRRHRETLNLHWPWIPFYRAKP